MTASRSRAHALTRFLHWTMAAAVLGLLAAVYAKGLFPKGTPLRAGLQSVHVQLGLVVGLLILPRLLSRLALPLPPIEPKPSAAVAGLSHLTHMLLYLGMLSLPVLGVLILQYNGKPVDLVGLSLPTLVGEDKGFAKVLKEIHETVGVAVMWLVGLHIAAALWHHLVVRDNTLLRMR
ncbi:cytochrome b [Crenobacter luteus]|uniref:Cytochrome b561 bacterial/Ni-hydrogenase domain-containing protein n=1 Tax=Crenobacter luteus TaxID=1452487 RepID=A0A161SBC0_9NEIS|nr:cytochrome b/b6 domain-containing protein [Crenobacter luteus]KZE33243.1 hypothetical protein AVW16_08705 [Crenobacter luteus]